METAQQTNGGSSASASIALVAPRWLQDALQVLLDGTSGVMLVASATDVDSLTMLDMDDAPDFVLLDADRDNLNAVAEVEQITHTWARTECVALVDNTAQIPLLKEAGASLSLLKGATPKRLREVLQALADNTPHRDYATHTLTPRL